ncbi:GntR family transcriptional regulator [Microbacterium sp.]|uniref:GntR family transcriptional regulator n=1 Tax=Microbacterium sp. TaxID=51671 RepID=UPI0039E34EA4
MLRIDPASPLPPYEQVRRQLAADIDAGDLPAATRLPTVRRLADDLGVAQGTIARAYRELEAAGYVSTRGRNGTTVTDRAAAADGEAARLAHSYLAAMHELGHDPTAAVRYLHRAIGAH